MWACYSLFQPLPPLITDHAKDSIGGPQGIDDPFSPDLCSPESPKSHRQQTVNMSAIEKRTSSKEEAGDNNVNRRHSKGELKWRNRSWTVVFIAVFVSYLILAIWVIFQVHKNADIYLDIDDAKLPSFLKNFRVEKRQNSEAGGLAVEQPPPVDL